MYLYGFFLFFIRSNPMYFNVYSLIKWIWIWIVEIIK